MTDEELEKLVDIFYENSPYDYVLEISPRKPKFYRGVCTYSVKVCTIFSPQNYMDALWVTLHELAHANIQHTTHSEAWDKEFTRLLNKYEYPRNLVSVQAEAIGPNLRQYMEG